MLMLLAGSSLAWVFSPNLVPLVGEPPSVELGVLLPETPSRIVQSEAKLDETPLWDDVSSDERLRILEEDFTEAVSSIEKSSSISRRDVLVAQGALTSMRAELHGTSAGRTLHHSYEIRLDRALDRVNEGDPR